MSKRVALYSRVSTDMQRGNFSVPSQVAECIKYAQQRNYTVIGDQFVDPDTGLDTTSGNGAIPAYVDDYTSRELSRPSLDAALNYLDTVGYDVLIVHSLDRLARDPYIRQTLEREFIAQGARIEYVLGNYEETPEGEIRKDLDATFAKWENAKRVERSNRGKRRKAESGLFVTGKSPYGYKRDDNALGGLAVDENQAEIIRRIFEMYAIEGLSVRAIVSRLTQEGIKTHSGSTAWAPTSIKRILRNTVYIGSLYYNKTTSQGNVRLARPREEWIEIPTTPIVETWMFDAAQIRFKENRERKRRQPKRFYLLSGLIICEKCGRPYVVQTYRAPYRRRKTEMKTYRHRKAAGHCMNKYYHARDIEPQVWEAVITILKDPRALRDGYEKSIEEQMAKHKRRQSHLETINVRIAKLDQIKMNLNEAYLDPDVPITKAEYIDQKNKIDTECKSLMKKIELAELELAFTPTPGELETLEAFSQEICERLDFVDLPPEEKRKILEMLHVTIILGVNGEARLDGWFNPASGSDGLLDRASSSWVVPGRCPLRPLLPHHPIR